MTKLCTITGCDSEQCARGLCKKHYNLWYRQNRTRVEEPPAPEPPAEPEITAELIDSLMAEQLDDMIRLRLYGWLPPSDGRTVAAFFRENPERKRQPRWFPYWLNRDGKLVYPDSPASSIHVAWRLRGDMLRHSDLARAGRFRRMLSAGNLFDIDDGRYGEPSPICEFICRCALKAHLLDVD